jgi:hypothetical protein
MVRFILAMLLVASVAGAGRGQAGKVLKPVNLGKVNSAADDVDPFIFPDNKTLLFASNVRGKFEIKISQRTSRGWTAGKTVPGLSGKDEDFRSPFLHRDGKLYFATNEVPDEELKKLQNFDIRFRSGDRAPLPLPGISEKHDELHPWITPGGKEFYFSRRGKEGWELHVARGPNPGPTGGARPVGLPPGFHHATLSKNGLIMYLQGPVDKERTGLFRCRRAHIGGAWSEPEPLVNVNNSQGKRGDMAPCLNADGTRLYFASDRPGGAGGLDLWVIDTASLKSH